MKWGPKKGILIFVDNDPQGYKLSCWGSFGLDFFSFIQIGHGHAAVQYDKFMPDFYLLPALYLPIHFKLPFMLPKSYS